MIRLRRRPKQPTGPTPFKLVKGQHTRPPIVVPYQIVGYGTLAATADTSSHYLRIRPFIGRSDPVLPRIVPHRKVLAHDLGTGERRDLEKSLWANLFRYPPTHVIRLGWVSHTTQHAHDILYLPLNFYSPGWNVNGLAKDCGSYLADCLQRCDDRPLLLPSTKTTFNPITNTRRSGTHFAAMFWLAQLFYHYKERTIERPRWW